jgi:hypothetical protein
METFSEQDIYHRYSFVEGRYQSTIILEWKLNWLCIGDDFGKSEPTIPGRNE